MPSPITIMEAWVKSNLPLQGKSTSFAWNPEADQTFVSTSSSELFGKCRRSSAKAQGQQKEAQRLCISGFPVHEEVKPSSSCSMGFFRWMHLRRFTFLH